MSGSYRHPPVISANLQLIKPEYVFHAQTSNSVLITEEFSVWWFPCTQLFPFSFAIEMTLISISNSLSSWWLYVFKQVVNYFNEV